MQGVICLLQMNEAILAAGEEVIANSSSSDASLWTVKVKHFEQVVTNISPSMSKKRSNFC